MPVPNVNKFTRLLYPRSRCSCVAPCAQTRLLVFACREMHGRGSAVGTVDVGVLWVLPSKLQPNNGCGSAVGTPADVGVLWVLWMSCFLGTSNIGPSENVRCEDRTAGRASECAESYVSVLSHCGSESGMRSQLRSHLFGASSCAHTTARGVCSCC